MNASMGAKIPDFFFLVFEILAVFDIQTTYYSVPERFHYRGEQHSRDNFEPS